MEQAGLLYSTIFSHRDAADSRSPGRIRRTDLAHYPVPGIQIRIKEYTEINLGPDLMGAKTAIVLLVVGLFVSLSLLFLRRRPEASSSAHGRTVGIEQIRQTLGDTKANYKATDPAAFDKAIDTFVASLKAQYGDEVPVVEAVKLLRNFQPPAGETASAVPKTEIPAGSDAEKTPDGISFESTPRGFLLRASHRDLITGVFWAVFVGVLAVLPFRIWGDLIRRVWTDEGVSWPIAAFLAVWAGAVLYAAAMGAVRSFGEIRIAKEGDTGEIFTGIGRLGRTHRLLWSEFYGVGERDEATYSSGRSSRTTHFVGLNGTSKEYKFVGFN
jgi:hypothetical protein